MSDDYQLPPTLTLGSYLRACRVLRGLTLQDVASKVSTLPRLSETDRIEWLRLIEADQVPASFATIVVLRTILHLDLDVCVTLALIMEGLLPLSAMPVICALCGSQRDAEPRMRAAAVSASACPACATPDVPVVIVGTAA